MYNEEKTWDRGEREGERNRERKGERGREWKEERVRERGREGGERENIDGIYMNIYFKTSGFL